MPNRAAFLDRDGTIIKDTGFIRDPDQVELLHGVGPALAELKRLGFLLVVISNQSGIGRGIIMPDEAERVHERMVELLAEGGVILDAAYYCPHRPEDGCRCRKPGIAHFERATLELDIDLAESIMVGDRDTDAQAGKAAGCRTILLNDESFASDWQELVQAIRSAHDLAKRDD